MQSAITISKTEFSNRQEIVEDVATFLKISREELSLESRDKISTVSYLHLASDKNAMRYYRFALFSLI